ncbi:hypothetical protein K435DRAFT_800435 [Dendrothele bispora CBS 962.96]|uniref:Uncharacterized protein n=1 Tax=Dendrothele bispora (strain CBS 962.96) TaxID=1314807 RepID=A0A4S8LSQ6_DENBC|nr:hypothetical protein K435DRAFT_800435 [Dendrothele bispora CBS 962.96]
MSLPTLRLLLQTCGLEAHTKLSTKEVGNHFFAVSTSLTQATPNSKKGLRRKGEEKKDKEERNPNPSSRWLFRLTWIGPRVDFQGNFKKEKNYTLQGFTGKIYLTGPHHNSVSNLDLVIVTSEMGQFDGFTRPGHLETNPYEHVNFSKYYENHDCNFRVSPLSIIISLNLLFRYLAPLRLCQQSHKCSR